uniref:C2H2-type domain-containing protein n=1 Tax=Bubo bubo TaxID=30461 RepID=A0A8C0EEV2_BUBBB
MSLKRHQLSPFGLPTGAGTDKQKEEQCQPREEQRGMLQGPEEEPQSPTVDVEHDGQQQPDDTQGSHGPSEPQKSSFKGTCAENTQEGRTTPWSSSRQKEYKCEHCGKVFTWGRSLHRHRQIHTGETPFNEYLQSHQRTHTKERPYLCTTCGKCFNSMRRHQRNHTGERPYKCPDCGKTFKDFSNLICHHRAHKGERPYKCLECGEWSTNSWGLSTHRRTRTTEKSSSCSDRGESFTQKQTLILNQRIHPREMLKRCQECQKTFWTRSHLAMHECFHVQESSHVCLFCGKSFNVGARCLVHQMPHLETVPLSQGASLGVMCHKIMGLSPPWVGTYSSLVSSS